jgi:exodeoxyribonuclease V alpha subunit
MSKAAQRPKELVLLMFPEVIRHYSAQSCTSTAGLQYLFYSSYFINPARADEPVVEKFGWQFRMRDKVIQTENDYDKDVFNGDIGQIVKIDPVEREVTMRFDQREVAYDYGELDEVSLAYAITIHKSQGSEFPAVVTPLAMQQYMLLQRNLVYTGVTRGEKLVVVIGQRKALGMAVRNNRTENRFSGLLARLKTD